ncbi:gamma-type small acid-soluble spore protein [Oceanobacillus saliphilus]|uniref:gamma-type small acid-soluble spore protein n=1 Tax=Oceanobacillus saliphilus TaxID=2925834 RepID=UPI00201D5C22|nr:gamma-type small acid-soluble spore protein [Oceanobacillus saliphilus]
MKVHNQDNLTVTGTNIDEVKKRNANSGMSYNEAKEFLARTTGGHGTSVYSDTDVEQVRMKNKKA